MKKTIIAVLCAAMLLGLTGCGNANSTSSAQGGAQQSQSEVETQQSQSEVVEYFDEKPDMVKPSAKFGATYLRNDDGTYIYSLSEDPDDAKASAQMYLAQLMGVFDVKNVDGTQYYNVYEDEEQFALVGLAKDGSDYVLAIAFFN